MQTHICTRTDTLTHTHTDTHGSVIDTVADYQDPAGKRQKVLIINGIIDPVNDGGGQLTTQHTHTHTHTHYVPPRTHDTNIEQVLDGGRTGPDQSFPPRRPAL